MRSIGRQRTEARPGGLRAADLLFGGALPRILRLARRAGAHRVGGQRLAPLPREELGGREILRRFRALGRQQLLDLGDELFHLALGLLGIEIGALEAVRPARHEIEEGAVDALGKRRQRVARQLGTLHPARARGLHLRVEIIGRGRIGRRIGGRQQRFELVDRRFAIGHLALERRPGRGS